MKHAFHSLVAAAVVASVVLAAGTASAQSAGEAKCHATIQKNITKYQSALAKNLAGCHKSRSGNKIPSTVNCNLHGQADTKGKNGAARTKAVGAITGTCGALTPTEQANILALYPRCPSPVRTSDDGGATTGIDNFTELGTCLLDLSEAYIDRIGGEVMGLPATTPVSKTVATCQGALGKALSGLVKTDGGSVAKCQAAQEKAAGGLAYDACATNPNDGGKLAASQAAFGTALTTSCAALTQADWIALGTCGQSVSQMTECAKNRTAVPTVNGIAGATAELTGTCASEADVVINAGHGVKTTATRLDSGWKGTSHNIDVVDQSRGAVALGPCDPDCANCTVKEDNRNGNCRCETTIPPLPFPADAATVECDNIEAADPKCGGGICHCMFGPPLAITASATPVCVVNRFSQQFTGSTGDVGEYSVGTRTSALVHLGISQVQPCPLCKGDASPHSGNHLGGTCVGGPRDGKACDQDANNPDFGPVSYDCPPDPGANISGTGLGLNLVFTSGTSSITAAIPAVNSPTAICKGGAGEHCQCSICTGDSTVGCTNNADCALFGAGTCGVALSNPPSQTSCFAGAAGCADNGDGSGHCTDGTHDVDNFCDGFTHKNGLGIITCTSDATCDANDCNGDGMVTPGSGECGTCGLQGFRQCYLPTVAATGTPGIYNSDGVSVFCSGQTGNGGVDNAGGLPGAGRVKLDFDFNLYCSDGTTQFQLPGGSNCP